MLNDIRYAFRSLGQNAGFAWVALLSVALGIGATSAIFSLGDGLLLRPLPVSNPSNVVTLVSRTPGQTFGDLSYRDYVDFRDNLQSFHSLAAYRPLQAGFTAEPGAQAQLRTGYIVSGNFFSVFGIQAAHGRTFLPEEDVVPGRDAVVVLGHDFWRTEMQGDPSVLGRRVLISGHNFEVVGVAPEGFSGMDQFLRPSFFVPAMTGPIVDIEIENRASRGFAVKGRLAAGSSVQTAAAEASAFAATFEQAYPETHRGFGATVRTEFQTRTDDNPYDALMLASFFALAVVVLCIACANVANLMLARGRARARELAVRQAVGASRTRLLRQLMTESFVIAVGGGTLGLAIAETAARIFSTVEVVSDFPIQLSFVVDTRVLGFTAFACCTSAVLFGLIPAFRASRVDLVPALKSGESDLVRQRLFGRQALVAVQVAGSLILLVAAADLYRNIARALDEHPGFQTERRITLRIDPSLAGYTADETERFYRSLIDRTRETPGVRSAALHYFVPMTAGARTDTVSPEGYQFSEGVESTIVFSDVVSEEFFETMGVPILAGRGFLPTDDPGGPAVAVVNQTFADRYFQGNAIGKRFQDFGHEGWIEIVGVVRTGKYFSVFMPPMEFIYFPLRQRPQPRLTLLAESHGDPAALAGPLQELVRSMDPNVPMLGIRTMEDLFEARSVKIGRIFNGTVLSMTLMGLVLALVGVYALVSYQVARRTREIGIRMALGSDRQRIVQMILKPTAIISVAGIAAGLIVSLATRNAFGMLTDAPPLDAWVLVLLSIALLLTALLAAAIPARRASRIAPLHALRQE